MFFLLRVVFWLAIVFASISWPEDVRPPARAEKACVSDPMACLEAAVGASQIVGEKRREGKAKAPLDSPAARPSRRSDWMESSNR
jgi:hypothetical protein